ncbi:phiRv1 phage protein [Mycolicibacterium flavescens]|uniref:DUF2742 domain-containing protein n=1 Tax=Mycobacterium neumannii TaxID=2048551 RepID=UPI000B944AFC|nr:DUF2742 domain-containing protein [Mycobacterium neumannii]VEG42722.1 phiRv1 phage protein [Mycolicibacterium flavescens]
MTDHPYSQQVSWWSVHEFVDGQLKMIGQFPMIGTPEWVSLDDLDARKWAAVYDAAQHWALHLEINQETRAEASRDVSAAEDWPVVAREITQRSMVYIPREAS